MRPPAAREPEEARRKGRGKKAKGKGKEKEKETDTAAEPEPEPAQAPAEKVLVVHKIDTLAAPDGTSHTIFSAVG